MQQFCEHIQEKLHKITWKQYLLSLGIIMVSLLFLMVPLFNTSPHLLEEAVPEVSEIVNESQDKKDKIMEKTLMVDVKGAVSKPGVYTLTEGKRVKDALDMAGGIVEGADMTQVNQAQLLTDQMLLYIPMKGEVSVSKGIPSQKKIHLNTASYEELKEVKGLGEKRAQQIIQYRQQKGPFKKLEDLKNISGIGDRTLEKLKDVLEV